MWKSIKNWLQEWVFNIYKWKLGRSRWIAYFENYLQKWFGHRYGEFPTAFPTRISHKISHKIFLQDFPATISHKIFPQQFPATISCKIFPQDFPELDPHRLAPHHPIPNAKFPRITAFLKLVFSPPPFPARFSHKNFPQDFPATISHKNFLQDFPRRFSRKNFPQYFPELHPDWLAPNHPIPNVKFPPITAFLKLVFSPPPFPVRFSRKIFPQDFPPRFSRNIFPSFILIGWLPITLFQMLNFHQSLPC